MSGTAVGAARRRTELALGSVALLVVALLLVIAVVGSGRRAEAGYALHAQFDHIDGLGIGSDVRIAGVRVGQVVAEHVDSRGFLADVTLTMRPDIRLPTDSSAVVTSDSLLGGKYLAISPGSNDAVLPPGGRITLTQGSISLEQLLSKFIFSVTDSLSAHRAGTGTGTGTGSAASPAAPATPSGGGP